MGEIRKYTSEMLMRDMGLQVGDRVRVKYETLDDQQVYETYEIKQCENRIYLENDDYQECMEFLVDTDYEILPRPKRVGDLKCGTKGKDGQNTCGDCPVRIICNHHACKELGCSNTLYEYLETYKTNLFEDDKDNVYDFDQEIYDLLKARLDKEVE